MSHAILLACDQTLRQDGKKLASEVSWRARNLLCVPSPERVKETVLRASAWEAYRSRFHSLSFFSSLAGSLFAGNISWTSVNSDMHTAFTAGVSHLKALSAW